VAFEPFLNRRAGKVEVAIPEQKGLYLLRYILKKADGTILHRNFTTFRVKKGTDPEGVRLISFSPASYTDSHWSRGSSQVYDGLKVNGFGNGWFEYTVDLPEDLDLNKVASAQLIFEASSRQVLGKDVAGNEIQGDFMLGGGTYDPCKSLNSFAMTDEILWPSSVVVSINGYNLSSTKLTDDPADHRGILSWGAQPNVPRIREAGTYGQLVSVNLPVQDAAGPGFRTLKVRFTVPESLDGGLSLFGKDFGRYPLDPTFVIKMK